MEGVQDSRRLNPVADEDVRLPLHFAVPVGRPHELPAVRREHREGVEFGVVVICSSPVPSWFTRYRSKLRERGFLWLDAKMMRRPSGWKNGAKLAPPRFVT